MGGLQAFCKRLTDERKAQLNEAGRALLDRLCAKRPSPILYGLDETTKKAWLEDFGAWLLRLHPCSSTQSSPRHERIERRLLEQYPIDSEGEAHRVMLKAANPAYTARRRDPRSSGGAGRTSDPRA